MNTLRGGPAEPATVIPDAMTAIKALNSATTHPVPWRTLDLVHLRANQLNGCAVHVGAAG